MKNIKTLGDLKKTNYTPKSIKEELRSNLLVALKNKTKIFDGILGYDDTVIPDVERAILSQHNILFLGLRGQAKTKMARLMVNLLDDYIPVVKGSELNDDPLQPISNYAKNLIAEKGDDTPIGWMHKSERYIEKLATPDVSVADLIGDVDPIKAANLRLDYSDEKVIHFGLIPRAHRCIFVVNELPDLQARIQVSLFNILQEGDIQIRGFKLRMDLDVNFIFTANPEDYTNRGSIITPLKDRIASQILTHYPGDRDSAKLITKQEANISPSQAEKVQLFEIYHDILEQISIEARDHMLIDEKSGVSVRLSITAYENLFSAAERRMLITDEENTVIRMTDMWGIIPSITGKLELNYEGELEGPYNVAIELIDEAIKEVFVDLFSDPNDEEQRNVYAPILAWFADGHNLVLENDSTQKAFQESLEIIPGLKRLAKTVSPVSDRETYALMELIVHGLAVMGSIERNIYDHNIDFSDPLNDVFPEDLFSDN